MTWSQGLSGNAAVAVRRQRERRQLERRRRGGHLSEVPDRSQVQRLLRRLLDRPTGATPAGGVDGRPQRRERVAVRSRLGVAHVQDHVLTGGAIMFRKTMLAASFAAIVQQRRICGGIGRRGEATRHDADAGRRRKGRQQGRHDSRVHRRHQAAGGLQGGQRLPPRPVRQREAAARHHRQGRGGARRQADRGHEGAAQALSDDARRRLPDASHGRACRSGCSTTR